MKKLKINTGVIALIVIFASILSSCSDSRRITRRGAKQIAKCNTSFSKKNSYNKRAIARFQKNQQLYFQ